MNLIFQRECVAIQFFMFHSLSLTMKRNLKIGEIANKKQNKKKKKKKKKKKSTFNN